MHVTIKRVLYSRVAGELYRIKVSPIEYKSHSNMGLHVAITRIEPAREARAPPLLGFGKGGLSAPQWLCYLSPSHLYLSSIIAQQCMHRCMC